MFRAKMTQVPWLDKLWHKNPYIATWKRQTGSPILKVVSEKINQRQQSIQADLKTGKREQINHRDFLSRFMEIQSTNTSAPPWYEQLLPHHRPQHFAPCHQTFNRHGANHHLKHRSITAWTFSNVIAGSDSTAVVMRTVFYNLLAYPASLKKLHEEFITAEHHHHLSRPYPKWSELRELPYLDACVNEAVRLHPPFCLPLEREVPEGGVTICGRYFTEGTVVGMNPYVVNRHRPTFGEDVDVWRPERWLGLDEEHRRKLEQSIMTVRCC
jgi:cytochrome P450